ncbi:Hint domain-containing protein [Rhodobacteraceae bacterium NNCM2]|nr:Hint domain-containing protein [Coraliihabitans acroporae]
MARISELHYSNALASSSGIAEFAEVTLGPGEVAANFTFALYNQDGTQFDTINLADAGGEVFTPADTSETIYVIDGPAFGFVLTDPDASGTSNIEAVALVDISTGTVIDFYDIGGGTQNITAQDGLAAGEVSVNLPVETSPNQAQGSLQFNQPNPDQLVTAPISRGSSGIPCFAAGTLLATPSGQMAVEDLAPGDLVETLDHGAQRAAWIGSVTVDAAGDLAPIVITRGTFGAACDLVVSPQHRVLVEGVMAQLLFGQPEILVAAKHLVNGDTVYRRAGGRVTYYHVLFDRHEIVLSNGVATESYHPSAANADGLACAARAELFSLFPELSTGVPPFDPCRKVARAFEARALVQMISATR